jgi:hypothetical protein
MSTTRPFAYNPGSSITGTIQVGDLAVGYPTTGYTGMEWWNGPDEELGYVIAQPVPNDSQPTPVPDDAITLSPTYKGTDIALSNNNQTASQIFSYSQTVLGETIISGSNKVMFSVKYTSTNPSVGVGGHFIGVGLTTMNYSGPFNGYPGNDTNSIGFSDDGQYYFNGVGTTGYPTWTDSDIIDIAIAHGQYWWIRVNGGVWNNNPSANPATNTGGALMNGLTNFYPALCPYIYGTMEVLNNPTYGYPSGYNFLGNVSASVGFFRTSGFNDSEFIDIANILLNENYINAPDASTGLTSNGYWNSYSTLTSPVLSLDAADYSGSGPWIDSIGGKSFTLYNNPAYGGGFGGFFGFQPSSAQYAECPTSLPTLSTWTVGVWHFYDGTNIGGSPCIVTEIFPGTNGTINYIIGNGTDTNPSLQTGFFTGAWNVNSAGYVLTTGWHYIVGTYDGTSVKLYVDNTLIDTLSTTTPSFSSNGGIRLMRRWDLSEYWGGLLSKVDIYNIDLDQTEITSIWNSTKSRFGL